MAAFSIVFQIGLELGSAFDKTEDILKDLRDIEAVLPLLLEVAEKANDHATDIRNNYSATFSDRERRNTLDSLLQGFRDEMKELVDIFIAIAPGLVDDGIWARVSKTVRIGSKEKELKRSKARLNWYHQTISAVISDVKGKSRAVAVEIGDGSLQPPFVPGCQVAAPLFDYTELQQYDKLQKEFKSEANGNAQDLAWKTDLLDLGAEQELLEEYLSWVQTEKTRREAPDLPLYFSRTSLGTEVMEKALEETRFLESLQEQLLLDRQEVLFDQGVNRHRHEKTTRDEREVWKRIIKVRKENIERSVLEKYEPGRRRELEEGGRSNTSNPVGKND